MQKREVCLFMIKILFKGNTTKKRKKSSRWNDLAYNWINYQLLFSYLLLFVHFVKQKRIAVLARLRHMPEKSATSRIREILAIKDTHAVPAILIFALTLKPYYPTQATLPIFSFTAKPIFGRKTLGGRELSGSYGAGMCSETKRNNGVNPTRIYAPCLDLCCSRSFVALSDKHDYGIAS